MPGQDLAFLLGGPEPVDQRAVGIPQGVEHQLPLFGLHGDPRRLAVLPQVPRGVGRNVQERLAGAPALGLPGQLPGQAPGDRLLAGSPRLRPFSPQLQDGRLGIEVPDGQALEFFLAQAGGEAHLVARPATALAVFEQPAGFLQAQFPALPRGPLEWSQLLYGVVPQVITIDAPAAERLERFTIVVEGLG